MAEVEIVEGADTGAIADWLEARIAAALAACDGKIAIAVPGGSTPFPIMEQLVKRNLDWSRLMVWPGDDRIVSEGHEASNTGKIRALFEPLGAKICPLTEDAAPPRFIFAWLGMGDDGHIASLFPNTDPRADDPRMLRRLTPDPLPPHAPFDRITLTMPALLNSGALLFTLGGSEAKRSVLEAAIAGENDLPIARLLGAAKQAATCFI